MRKKEEREIFYPLLPYRASRKDHNSGTVDAEVDYMQQLLGPIECARLIEMAWEDIRKGRAKNDQTGIEGTGSIRDC